MEPRNIDNTHEITGQVDYAIKKKYRWISESGKNTCEKCKSLNGKVFELKDLPKRPHPNCKCRVEEISIVEGAVAKLYGYRDEKFNLEIDAKEILGDLSVIRKKIHEELDIVGYSEIIEKKEKLLSDIQALEIEVNRYIDRLPELGRFSDEELFQQKSIELIHFRTNVTNLNNELAIVKARFGQLWLNGLVENNKDFGPDAAAIWKLATSKFTDGLEYISENGYLVNKISDLYNKDLETFVRTKVKEQYKQNESRGIILKDDSTLAKSIMKSAIIKNFINNNIFKIVKNNRLEDTSLKFDIKRGTNNYLALNYAYIKNIYLDSNDILHMTIFDTVDYNYGEKLVKIPRKIQEACLLENYYIIVNVSIPLPNAKYAREHLKKHNK
ncbi:MAG: hypothetical protein VZR09_07380 [Candidatus Gastranaerophilaceae bacterium]|nr:hypothetical protein [Candidatus Gastranaerophilaceae bacterium]